MTWLSKQLRANSKAGALIPAIVIDVFYGRASVKLSGNGALIRNLAVVGGPVLAGQAVQVDFTTPEPTVVALGQESLSMDDIVALLKGLAVPGQTDLFSWQILTFSQGVLTGIYTADPIGLANACSDATDGVIFLPPCEIAGDFVLAGNATMVGMDRDKCIISGTIMAYGGLCSLSVINSENSEEDVYALRTNPNIVEVSYRDILVYATNSGGGQAHAVRLEGSKIQRFIDCQIFGEHAAAGEGYGLFVTTQMVSDAYFNSGYVGGTTAPFSKEA